MQKRRDLPTAAQRQVERIGTFFLCMGWALFILTGWKITHWGNVKHLQRATNEKRDGLKTDQQQRKKNKAEGEVRHTQDTGGFGWEKMIDRQQASRGKEGGPWGCPAAEDGWGRTTQNTDRQMEEGYHLEAGPQSPAEHLPILTPESTLWRSTVYWELSVSQAQAWTCAHFIKSDLCQPPWFLRQKVMEKFFLAGPLPVSKD